MKYFVVLYHWEGYWEFSDIMEFSSLKEAKKFMRQTQKEEGGRWLTCHSFGVKGDWMVRLEEGVTPRLAKPVTRGDKFLKVVGDVLTVAVAVTFISFVAYRMGLLIVLDHYLGMLWG